jgi:hypothetical protein
MILNIATLQNWGKTKKKKKKKKIKITPPNFLFPHHSQRAVTKRLQIYHPKQKNGAQTHHGLLGNLSH